MRHTSSNFANMILQYCILTDTIVDNRERHLIFLLEFQLEFLKNSDVVCFRILQLFCSVFRSDLRSDFRSEFRPEFRSEFQSEFRSEFLSDFRTEFRSEFQPQRHPEFHPEFRSKKYLPSAKSCMLRFVNRMYFPLFDEIVS